MKYRLGKKQRRALLDENGLEVALFSKGQEKLAEAACSLLNDQPTSIEVHCYKITFEESGTKRLVVIWASSFSTAWAQVEIKYPPGFIQFRDYIVEQTALIHL